MNDSTCRGLGSLMSGVRSSLLKANPATKPVTNMNALLDESLLLGTLVLNTVCGRML
jgi:hypothetical protein